MRNPPEHQERPLTLPPKPAPAPAQPRQTWKPHAPGIERNQDGQLRTVPPPAAFVELDEEDLPDGLTRATDGRLTYRCPRCERNDAEYFGDDPADFDPTFPCGGSPWCLP